MAKWKEVTAKTMSTFMPHTFYSFADFSTQLKRYNCRDYNNFPMRPLGWKTPNQVLRDFSTVSVTNV